MKLAEALVSAAAVRGRRPRRHVEDDLQIAVIDYLRLVLDPKRFIAFHVPNGGSRNAREGARLKRGGVLAGVPDVCILGSLGRTYWIEIKAIAGRLSEPQEAIQAFNIRNGVPYVVARSVSDVEAALSAWGLKSRAAA